MVAMDSLSLLDFSHATIQEAGEQWSINCSPPPSLVARVTAMTWETEDGAELTRSSTDSVVFTAPVNDSQHHQQLVCYSWEGNQMIHALYLTLIVQGMY